MTVKSIVNIEGSTVQRIQSGFPALDLILGTTGTFSGFAIGRVTYMSGRAGIGKTRLAIAISKAINARNKRIMYFQGEAPLEEFRQWTGNNIIFPEKFDVSDDKELKVALQNLEDYRPDFVVIDSANMIEGFNKQEGCRDIFEAFKEKVAEYGSHCLMIGHLTKAGLTKGSADVEHLVDVVCKVDFPDPVAPQTITLPDGRTQTTEYELKPNHFRITVTKNRYGTSGGWVSFRHTNEGIEYVRSNVMAMRPEILRPIGEPTKEDIMEFVASLSKPNEPIEYEDISPKDGFMTRFCNWIRN